MLNICLWYFEYLNKGRCIFAAFLKSQLRPPYRALHIAKYAKKKQIMSRWQCLIMTLQKCVFWHLQCDGATISCLQAKIFVNFRTFFNDFDSWQHILCVYKHLNFKRNFSINVIHFLNRRFISQQIIIFCRTRSLWAKL